VNVAEKEQSMFSQRVAVSTRIAAPAEVVWRRLTDAAGFPAWNSTVTRIDGQIRLSEKLAIQVPAAPGRTFSPRVTAFEDNVRMVWSDGFFPMFRGTRTFSLVSEEGGTRFLMEEKFEGLMLPMIRGSLPDFGPIFDRYAADLKSACEAR
jgi:uncharacterized protein YndB with AHSA1/START domain